MQILDDGNTITRVLDDPADGGACHVYGVYTKDKKQLEVGFTKFQMGPVKEYGVNGTSNESHLAIVIHRLKGFQSGEYSCEENGKALFHVKEALRWLQKRTEGREKRGVEGTSEK